MSSLLDEAYAVLKDAMAFYCAHGCPCAYPRFRQVAGFDFRPFGTSPVGWHLQEILVGLAAFAKEPPYRILTEWQGTGRKQVCVVCGTQVEVISEEFSINVQMVRMEFPQVVKARRRGLDAGLVPVPQRGGFFGFSAAAIEKCEAALTAEGTFEELGRYMKGIELAWPAK